MGGPGRTQEIYAGSFATQGAKDKLINDLNELAVSTQRAGGANPIALFNLAYILAGDLQKKEAPEAYLIYALYDQDSNRYEVGKKVLTKNAANQHEILEEEMYISKDGYMETFVVNETSEDVWFDNMMVMSISSVIVQETHFDPWGLELTGLGYQYGGIKANKFLYNGKELIEDNGLQYYDYGARMYDPAIGRWGVVDPFTQKMPNFSPYTYAFNNPIRFIDFAGLYPIEIVTRSYAPYKTFGPGNNWYGDDRAASVNRNASSRSSVTITHDTETRLTKATGSSRRSHTVDGSKDGKSTTVVNRNNSKGSKIDVHSAGRNEAQQGSWDIDQFTKLNASIEGNVKDNHVLNISGTISGDDFPNQESMIYDNEGNGVMLGAFETSGNRQWGPVTDLPLENEGDIQMIVGVRISVDKNGVFQGIMVNENGKNKQISIVDWNNLFIKTDGN